MAEGALSHLRICDFTGQLAGAGATKILAAFGAQVPKAAEISRFPAVRRDLAVLLAEDVAWEAVEREARAAGGNLLQEVRLFDVYRGERIDSGLKSIALGLILQETSRTLTDDDADQVVAAVISRLERAFEARIRD